MSAKKVDRLTVSSEVSSTVDITLRSPTRVMSAKLSPEMARQLSVALLALADYAENKSKERVIPLNLEL